MDLKYKLSKIIPVHFSTTYIEEGERKYTNWWQWRDTPFFIKDTGKHVVTAGEMARRKHIICKHEFFKEHWLRKLLRWLRVS